MAQLLFADEREAATHVAAISAAHAELLQQLAGSRAPLPAREFGRAFPLLAGRVLVGIWGSCAQGSAVWFFILPAERRQGWGDAAVEALACAGQDLVLPGDSPALGYFEERGYRAVVAESAWLQLRPPTRLDGVRAAASVCLYEPKSAQLLIGERLTPPWPNYWAFPGGKLEAGETTLAGALRELHEETGIALARPEVLLETRVYAGGAGSIYVIDNFCVRAPALTAPRTTDEVRARWVPLTQVSNLRPMAAGTRRVLRRVLTEVVPQIANEARS
jgi:8-oxo-dGTP pyrophosphatase MutT (NUDIX family)